MEKSLDFDQLFPGRFIKAGEFEGRDVHLTIEEIKLEELPQDKGPDKIRGIVSFAETKKQWVLNRTNAECLKAMWGRAVADWCGKKVTLFPTMVSVGPKKELAVRVRGAPHLTEPLTFEITLPRRKPISYTLVPTGKTKTAPAKQSEPEQEPEV